MRTLVATDIDAALVIAIADIQQVRERVALPLESLLSWWGNIDTGIDLKTLARAGETICTALGKQPQSKVANAILASEE